MSYKKNCLKIMSLAMIVALLAITGQQPQRTQAAVSFTKMPPALSQIMATSGSKQIPVMVMKADNSNNVEAFVASLGVDIRVHLKMLNAFAIEVTADKLQKIVNHKGVKWVSLDGEMESSGIVSPRDNFRYSPSGTSGRALRSMDVQKAWFHNYTGKGIGVAVIDSGITAFDDLNSPTSRLVASVDFDGDAVNSTDDDYGHGTHVASVIASNGQASGYMGVAPEVNIVNLKVADNRGRAKLSSVVAAMEWVLNNKTQYNIRVVNLSLNTTWAESYHTSPIDAAAEILWFNKIVVVTSSGNKGVGKVYAPANDPFVITVGAVANAGTDIVWDDSVAPFSAYGKTESGFSKPDVVAHGYGINGVTSPNSYLYTTYPTARSGAKGFLMTGTSASAPLVSGAVALLLSKSPNLTPDQVKYRLLTTSDKNWQGYLAEAAGGGQVNVESLIDSRSTNSANTGVEMSKMLTQASNTRTIGSSVSWNSVSWNSVSWNSVSWNSVSWSSNAHNSSAKSSIFLDDLDNVSNGKAVQVPANGDGVIDSVKAVDTSTK